MSEPARRPITVVGSLMVDVFARAPSWPTPSRITHGEFGLIDSGGKGANQALIAARMGWPTCLIGCVGLDWIGAALIAQLNAGGVDTTRVLRTPTHHTGLFIALSTDEQERGGLAVNGANGALRAEDVEQHAHLLHTSAAVITQLEIPMPAVETALRLADRSGVLTILNAAPHSDFPRALLRWCEYVIVNAHEASRLTDLNVRTPAEAAQAAAHIHALGARNVIITLGTDGVYAHAGHYQEHVPADSTINAAPNADIGAGDAFVGAFSVRLCEGASVREAMRFGMVAAALSVKQTGAQLGLPTRNEVDRLMNDALA